MAMNSQGVRFLDQDRVEGIDPTTLFGEHTIMSLKREDAMTHAPDILLLSEYDPELGEVAAFEELIGSHGGLGGPQTKPFILHPTEWTLDEEVPLGAPAVYRNIRAWLGSIGIELGRPAGAPAETDDRGAGGGWSRAQGLARDPGLRGRGSPIDLRLGDEPDVVDALARSCRRPPCRRRSSTAACRCRPPAWRRHRARRS